MSDDLISRKALLEVLNKRLADYSCDSNSGAQRIADIYKYELIPVVENAPTAFDKEKVIDELEYDKEMSAKYSTGLREQGHIEAFDEAISIVKKGGINNILL